MTTTARTIDDANALLLFKVGPVYCCSPTLPVVSVQMPPRLSHPPGTSEAQPGVFKYSTGIVRVVDLRQRFGVDDEDRQHPGRIVVAEVTGGLAGFWVDEIIDVIHFPDQGWGEVPALVPRTVFSRTLLFNKQIQLYAEFEALNGFRKTGYLRQHIQVLKSRQQQLDDPAAEQSTGSGQNGAAELRNTSTPSMAGRPSEKDQPVAGETGYQQDAKLPSEPGTQQSSTMDPSASSARSPAVSPRPPVLPSEPSPTPTPTSTSTSTPTPAPTPAPTTGGMSSPGSPPVASLSGAPGRPGPHSRHHSDAPRQAEPGGERVSEDPARPDNRSSDNSRSDNSRPDNSRPDNRSRVASPHGSGAAAAPVSPAADGRVSAQSSVVSSSAVKSSALNSSAAESSGNRDSVAWFLLAMLLVVILLGGYFIGDRVTGPDDRPVALEPAVDLGSRPEYQAPQVEELRPLEPPPRESQVDAGASASIETAPPPGGDGDSNTGELSRKPPGSIASNIDTPEVPGPPGRSDDTGPQAQSTVSRPRSADSYWRSKPDGSVDTGVPQALPPSEAPVSPQQLDAVVSNAHAPSYRASIDRDEQGLVITINAPDDELLVNVDTDPGLELIESPRADMGSTDAASIETGSEESGSSHGGAIALDRQDLVNASRHLQSSPIGVPAERPALLERESAAAGGATGSADGLHKTIEPGMAEKAVDEKTIEEKTAGEKNLEEKNRGQKAADKNSTKQNTAEKKTTKRKSASTTIIHIVVKGDTLWHIAKRYINNPYRYPELARLSKIKNPDLIYPGDRVKIILNRTAPASRRQ